MTQEQENDLNILTTLSLGKFYTKPQLALACHVFGVDAIAFIDKPGNDRYLQIVDDPMAIIDGNNIRMPDNLEDLSKFGISAAGKIYLKWLESEKQRELFDSEVKKATLKTNTFQKNVVYVSLAIALVSGLIPLFIQLTDDKKMQLESPAIDSIQVTQKALQQNVLEIQKILQKKDTLKKDSLKL